ncbi:MAG: hypothetical protein J6A76_00765, partial [Oscillospiraceae bacterium]|nr:hypothetical protein [Oscillospiraceae bacterium]
MFRKKRFGLLGFLLAVILITVLLTVTAFSTENAVYISVSYDGRYIEDKNGSLIANIAVPLDELAAIDLNDHCLSEYSCDNDHDGEPDITALQLVIYAHENIYGGDWSDVVFSGSPGSSYFEGGIFGFSENLNYYLNGQYPLAGEGWGATSDQIVLSAGDFLDIASFSSWDFYQDSAFGFFYFTDENGDITHSYEAKVETPLTIKLVKGTKDYEYNSVVYEMPDCEVLYGTAYGDAKGSVTTDSSGCAEITFDSAGEWFLWVNGAYGSEYPDSIVSAPGYACVEVEANESTSAPDESLDISGILNDTMANLAKTVSEPAFGTDAGEWTVLSLARGGYYSKNSEYFSDYYGRIVEIVNSKAAEVDSNGALHKNKSTDNSRLIVALSSIGKDATSVGNWDITAPYSDFSWVKNQGINGVIWALIALDSNDYKTTDSTIRQQCVDAILDSRHNDGGWALTANKDYASDPDITAMALQALYPYRAQTEVKTACEEAFELLSELQHQNGTFSSDGSECAESCAQVIIACTTWGIDPDTDSRFVKGENSVVDGLLAHYLEDSNSFEHIIGAGENGMATDQACCALVAYSRFLKSENSLYDFGDVEFET